MKKEKKAAKIIKSSQKARPKADKAKIQFGVKELRV
jgi:hypothetical protein